MLTLAVDNDKRDGDDVHEKQGDKYSRLGNGQGRTAKPDGINFSNDGDGIFHERRHTGGRARENDVAGLVSCDQALVGGSDALPVTVFYAKNLF